MSRYNRNNKYYTLSIPTLTSNLLKKIYLGNKVSV